MTDYSNTGHQAPPTLRLVEADVVNDVLSALEMLGDAFGTDDITLLGLLAPHMDAPDVAAVALALEMCPVHMAHREVCADDGRTKYDEATEADR